MNSDVLKLLSSWSQMDELLFFANISPLSSELLSLISSVHIVEGGELWTKEISEMSSFNISKIESNQIFVMPDQSSNPLIV